MKHVSNGSMIRWMGASALGFILAGCAVESADQLTNAEDEGLATGSTCSLAHEGTQTTLSCPSGTISKVVFASYGTPSGTCSGTFTKSACTSATSQSVVEAACLGKASCTLSAERGRGPSNQLTGQNEICSASAQAEATRYAA